MYLSLNFRSAIKKGSSPINIGKMLKCAQGYTVAALMLLTAITSPVHCTKDSNKEAFHPRHARQLHRMLDPFGLLGKAGEAVSGAVAGMQDAVEGFGKTLDEGAQHVGKMLEHGATSLDSVIKDHLTQVNAGMEEAGKVAKIVSEDIVDSMSTLVSNHLKSSSAFSSPSSSSSTSEDEVMTREGIVDGVLRMFGIDPSQIGLMALNILIFIAEMITSSLIGADRLNEVDPENRSISMSMVSWLLNNDPNKVNSLLKEAQDPSLPRHIIEKLVASTGDSTACVQLLVCKMSPIIWGIQGTVKDSAQSRSMDPDAPEKGIFQSVYESLPKLEDFVRFSESCETQFPSCPLLSLSDLGL